MPIEDAAAYPELLKRALEHYKTQLERLSEDKQIKQVLTPEVEKLLNSGTKRHTDYVNKALADKELFDTGIGATDSDRRLSVRQFSDILKLAVKQYKTDLENVKSRVKQLLGEISFEQLDRDLSDAKQILGET